jgi:hypothetical protein
LRSQYVKSEEDYKIYLSSGDGNKIEPLLKTDLGKCINTFLKFLEDEIKKFYKFYNELERKIYEEMNKHLHQEPKFE